MKENMVTYDNESLYQGLVAHGLIIPSGVPGVFGRNAVFEEVVTRFNNLVSQLAVEDGAQELAFPPLINRNIIERVNYLESFPHLCGAVHSFFGDAIQALALAERARSGQPWGELLGQTQLALTPAICYPLYPSLAGVLPEQGRLISLMGWAYRQEPSPEPTRMQTFRMREFVRAGTAEQVVAWRDNWLQRGLDLLASLELPVKSDIASDPFFGRGGKMMKANQREQKLKFELLVPIISQTDPTAVASFNFHQDKFGSEFGIHMPDGSVANTACLGFGLERITMGLFKAHGFDPKQWPQSVRERLWS